MSRYQPSSSPSGPPPQNKLERLLKKGHDPSLMGQIVRLLEESELFIYVPPHPELEGEMIRSVDDPLSFVVLGDEKGSFVAVFTSFECAAYESRRLKAKGPQPMIAGLPGRVLFGHLAQGGHQARVMACGGGTLKMNAEGVLLMAQGKLGRTERKAGQTGKSTHVQPVPLETLSPPLVKAVRELCDKRSTPLSVWVFYSLDDETRVPNLGEYRFILWLREADANFEQDFGLMTSRLLPAGMEMLVGSVLPHQEDQLTYLRTVPPLWPAFDAEALAVE